MVDHGVVDLGELVHFVERAAGAAGFAQPDLAAHFGVYAAFRPFYGPLLVDSI